MSGPFRDGILETTETEGAASPYQLAGAVIGWHAFGDPGMFGDGDRVIYYVENASYGGSHREVVDGIYDATNNRLSRGTILSSTNGGAAVDWPAGLKRIACGLPAAPLNLLLEHWTPGQAGIRFGDVADPGAGKVNALDLQVDGVSLPGPENLIVNGDFRVAQRGTSFAAAASGDTTLDLWRYFKTGAMVHSIAQSADVPSVAEAGVLAAASLHVDCTTADASLAGTDNAGIYHRIEGWRFRAIAQRAFTLTFWAKATKPGVYCVSFRNAGPDFRSYVAEYTVEAAGAWERKTITVPASPAAGDWDYGAGIGLQVIWSFGTGPTLQTTPGVWQTGNFSGTASQVNACDSAANDFRLALVQLVPGEGRVPFRPRDFAEELALCQRYVEKSYDHAVAPGTSLSNPGVVHLVVPSNTIAAGQEYGSIRFAAPKRAAPTVTIYGYTGGSGVVSNTSGTERPANSGAVQMAGESGFTVFNNSGGDVTTTGNVVMFHWLASAEL